MAPSTTPSILKFYYSTINSPHWGLRLFLLVFFLFSDRTLSVRALKVSLATGTELIKDGVDDFTEIHFSCFASSDFAGNEVSEKIPWGFGEVGRIRFAAVFMVAL